MALVKRVESDVMNKVSTNKNPGPPRTTEGGSRPAINTSNNKTTTTSQRPMSQQNPRSKLPERQLLSRYRHVYAGKGGLFVSRTSFAPPVNFNSSANSQYLDVYRKGLILRISQNIFENSKQTLNKNNVVSNKVSGEQENISNIESPTSLTLKVSDSQKKIGLKREENVPELISDKDLKAIQQEDPDYNGSPVDNNTNESVNTKGIDINGGIDMRNGGSSERNNNKTLEHTKQEDYVNTRLNENDNCFITSFKRAHTIIGTIHPRDIQVSGNSVSQTEQNKQSEQHEHGVLLHREKLTNTQNVVKENICEVNTSEVHDICDTEQSRFNKSKSAKKKQRKDKYALGELELNVLRQRSFVKLPSKMAVVEQRPFSRGALIRSGKRLPTRMSQEALLAINETRKEMGIEVCTEDRRDTLNGNLIQAYSDEDNLHSTDVDIRLQNNSDNDNNNKRDSDVVYSKNFVNENKNSPDSLVQQDQSSDRIVHHPSHLLQPSCDSFESTMDSRTSLNGGPKRLSKSCAKKDKFHVFTADEIKQQLKKTNASRKLSSNNKGIKSTEATPISPELGLMPPVGLERKQDSARYSFNLSRDRSPRYGNKRYFSPNTKLSKDNSLSQSNVFLNSPRTKLPHLKLASKSQEDVRLDGVYTSRSRNSSRIKSPKEILEEAEDTLSPLNAKNMQNWKSGGVGHPGLSKEKSFQITPPGWDVRYKDIYGKKGHVDFNDDTPEEVKERAIEKCSDWLLKYM